MKAAKLRDLDAADLQRQAQESQEQLFRIRFQMGMGQTEGLKKYRNLKKDRARMLTVLRERESSGQGAASVANAASPDKKKKK